jgi:predicted regulator of Ras-like GTPase activity (Roadblock/LC7/MglB family)
MVNESPKRLDEGGGEIVGLGLTDVIQIQNHNRFSGCISVESTGGSGLLFFRDGEVIHAEQGRHLGEDAFLEIVAWPPGKYRLQPNVATTRSTIQKNAQHLLLEAHRILDERRAGRGAPPASPAGGTASAPAAAPGARAPMRASDVLEKLRRVPGVEYAALTGKDGAKVADDSYEAEMLGGQAVFLSMIGNQLGALFQAGQMLSAAVHGAKKHLLLFSTKSHFLSVVVKGEAQPGPVEAEVRKILSAR